MSDTTVVRTGTPGNERLDQLVAMYAQLKPRVDELNKQFNDVVAAIKSELADTAPGETKIDLVSDMLDAPLRMSWREQWRVDSKRLKKEAPEIYVRFAKKSGYWELRKVA